MRVYVWYNATLEEVEQELDAPDLRSCKTQDESLELMAAPHVGGITEFFDKAKEDGLEEIKKFYKENYEGDPNKDPGEDAYYYHNVIKKGEWIWLLPVHQKGYGLTGLVVIRAMDVT